eukprot:TRINITY_DN19866_c0_g1_i1.p1 TRINITY_DN19866_c0_g1~~TRINITY_DN19866_c0_g1_i1.p1  ORF type:complete len:724 (-),score=172.09 TRINITY_DN19866_c0_g1_i1:160-2331(-)
MANFGEAAAAASDIPLVPPCRFLLRAVAASRVIGRGGESIRALRATGATVKVLQEELPEALRRREECLVLVSCGEASALRAGIYGVLDRLFDRSGLPDMAERSRDRPFAVDMVVPERAAGVLVGPRGERIKQLIDELGCDISVVREPVPGVLAQRRVRVLSRNAEAAKGAVWKLQEVLAEFLRSGALLAENFELRELLATDEEKKRIEAAAASGEVPLRIVLGQGEAALVVGRMGLNIRAMRDVAEVSIDDAPCPPLDAAERVCSVSKAQLSDRLRVARHVVQDIASKQDPSSAPAPNRMARVRILLPNERWQDVAGLAQGHAALGPDLALQCTAAGATMQMVEMRGIVDQVVSGIWRLHQTLEPWEPREMPEHRPIAGVGGEPGGGERMGGGGGGGGGVAMGSTEKYPVFVAGMSFDTTKERLEAHFSALGDISYCHVLTDRETGASRGMGKVVFESEESRRRAIEELNNSELDGRSINVREFQPVSRAAGGGQVGEPIVPMRRMPPVGLNAQDASSQRSSDLVEGTSFAGGGFAASSQAPGRSQMTSFTASPGDSYEATSASAAASPAPSYTQAGRPEEEAPRPRGVNETGHPAPMPPPQARERPVEPMQPPIAAPIVAPAGYSTPAAPPMAAQPAAEQCRAVSPAGLRVAVATPELAAFLASEASGIARRSGAKIITPLANTRSGPFLVEIHGSLEQGAVACYLIQLQTWMAGFFGKRVG